MSDNKHARTRTRIHTHPHTNAHTRLTRHTRQTRMHRHTTRTPRQAGTRTPSLQSRAGRRILRAVWLSASVCVHDARNTKHESQYKATHTTAHSTQHDTTHHHTRAKPCVAGTA